MSCSSKLNLAEIWRFAWIGRLWKSMESVNLLKNKFRIAKIVPLQQLWVPDLAKIEILMDYEYRFPVGGPVTDVTKTIETDQELPA